jgi:hypothetical protein
MQIKQLLFEFQDIIQILSLPPPRFCDHQITLAHNNEPFILRTCRFFFYFQKLELEKNLKDLLQNGFI